MLKKIVCFLLVAATFLLLFSCARTPKKNPNGGSEKTDGGSDASLLAKLPSKNFENREFVILTRSEFFYEMGGASESNDRLDNYIYERNSAIEERYRLILDVRSVPGNWQNRNEFHDTIYNDVAYNDTCTYDLICGAQNQMVSYITEGMFANLLRVNNNNGFSDEWWFDGFVENLSINNHLYFIVGDAGVTLLENCNSIVFNKNLCDANGISYPYDLVREKQWTLSAMYEMTDNLKAVDLDGDQKLTVNDRFSLVGGTAMLRGLSIAFDAPVTKMDENGYPVLAMGDQKVYDVFDRFTKFIFADNRCLIDNENNNADLFGNGHSLLLMAPFSTITALRQNYAANYGIVPYPMYDENQADYYTACYETLTVFTIPINAGSREDSMFVLNALGAKSLESVTPKYFEMVLKYQNAQDPDSFEMIELIRNKITFNFGATYSMAIDAPIARYDNMANPTWTYASSYRSKSESWRTMLSTLVDNFLLMDE